MIYTMYYRKKNLEVLRQVIIQPEKTLLYWLSNLPAEDDYHLQLEWQISV